MTDLKEAISQATKFKKGEPLSSHKLTYDAPSSQLEPIYFWVLDFIQDMGIKVEKITDNFTSSPGSGHFAEMGARTTRMQEEGMKILGLINQVVKTVLNLIYDLKEFEIRLDHYKDARSEDKEKKEGGLLALKQIWLDNVDLKRGRGSIHQMSYEMGFTTLRESFLVADALEDVDKNQIINDQVKRILKPRVAEFLKWKDYSEKELKKRFQIEKSYLKSSVESIKLYTSWVRPYLKAAEELRQKGFENNPSLVGAFNTTMFELVLFCTLPQEKMPERFREYNLKRGYNSCFVVSLKFRGFPQKVTQQHYGFGGRVDMEFDSYALNDQEIELMKKNFEKQDIEDTMKFAQQATDDSLVELKEDIDHFLYGGENPADEKEKKEKKQDDTNPFSALFSLLKPSSGKDKGNGKDKDKAITEAKQIKKDNFVEAKVRLMALETAKARLYTIYDIYKKAHGMASAPGEGFDSSGDV